MAKWKIYAIPYPGRTRFIRAGISFPSFPDYVVMDEKEIPSAVWDEPSLVKERILDDEAPVPEGKTKKGKQEGG